MKLFTRKAPCAVLALLLAAVLLVGLLPLSASAAYTGSVDNTFTFTSSGISAASDTGTGYKISGTALTINAAGTYRITGNCANGSITVKKGTTGVTLVLDDLTLTSTDTAPLCCNKTSEVTLYISGTVTLTDAEDPANETNTDEAVADAFEGAAIKVKSGSYIVFGSAGMGGGTQPGQGGTPGQPGGQQPGQGGTQPTQTVGGFTDVSASSYYASAVEWAVQQGITNGTSATTFSPEQSCTRAQAVTFLWRAAGSPEPTSTACPFTDVSSTSYYYKAVLWAYENGITLGTSDTAFSPNATVTRAQVVTFLCRALNGSASGSNPFSDVADSAYYYSAVLWAVANNITNGTTATTFSPNATCTRAQIVTFLCRAYQ